MRLDRQLARFLAATIVMIVAYLAPSAVQAHAGHNHAARAVVSVSAAAPDVTLATSHTLVVGSALLVEAKATDVMVGATDPDAQTPLKTCTGPCCCGSGMACHGHAATLDPGGQIVMGATTRMVAPPEELARLGVGPEALPKPPRSFA